MKRKLNKKKVVFFVLIILIFVLTIVFTILYRKNLSIRVFFDEYIFRKNITENTLPMISTEGNYTYAYDDYIVCLDKNVLTFYNKSANKTSSVDLEISEPIFESCGDFLCIAEKNGSKLYLISNKNIIWQKDIEGKISNLTVNKNGYVAISITGTTHETICKIYDDNGRELFTTYHSTSYVIDSAISNDNKFVALAEINFSGIAIQSNVKVISIDKALSNSTDTTEYNYTAPIDAFIVNIHYCGDDLVCIYDNHIDIIRNNSTSEITNFESSNIIFADINNDLIQIEKHDTGLVSSKFELQIIDTKTNEKKLYSIDREPKSVEVFGNIIAINFGTEIIFINNSGWLIKNYTSSQEIQSIVLSSDLAGIVFKDKIEILSL